MQKYTFLIWYYYFKTTPKKEQRVLLYKPTNKNHECKKKNHMYFSIKSTNNRTNVLPM